MTHPGDDQDKKRRLLPLGDIGTIALAGAFLAAMIGTVLFLFSSPEPVRDLFGNKPPKEDSGVVTIQIQKKN